MQEEKQTEVSYSDQYSSILSVISVHFSFVSGRLHYKKLLVHANESMEDESSDEDN